MLYVIKDKFYVLVSGYYKEVTVSKDAKGYDVKAVKNGHKIEASTVKDFSTISVEKAADKIIKKPLDIQ